MKVNFRLDPDLIKGLSDGYTEKPRVETKRSVAPLGPGKAPHGFSRVQKAALDSVRKDAELRYALASTNKVGDLLVKREAEEVPKVKAFAEELRQKYPTKGMSIPCQTEMEACLECYEGGDVTKCGPVVDAYGNCAADAWKQVLKSKANAKANVAETNA